MAGALRRRNWWVTVVAAICALVVALLLPADGERCAANPAACPCAAGQPSDDGPVAKRQSCCSGEESETVAASGVAVLSDGDVGPVLAAERADRVAHVLPVAPRRVAFRPVTRGPPPKPRYLEYRTLLL